MTFFVTWLAHETSSFNLYLGNHKNQLNKLFGRAGFRYCFNPSKSVLSLLNPIFFNQLFNQRQHFLRLIDIFDLKRVLCRAMDKDGAYIEQSLYSALLGINFRNIP